MKKVYVLADSGGFVAATSTPTKAHAICKLYPFAEFIYYEFDLNPQINSKEVYILPFAGTMIDSVAFVSNDIDAVKKVQATYLKANLTYPEDPATWKHEIDTISSPAKTRLDNAAEMVKNAGMEFLAEKKLFDDVKREKEMISFSDEKIDILQHIMPRDTNTLDETAEPPNDGHTQTNNMSQTSGDQSSKDS